MASSKKVSSTKLTALLNEVSEFGVPEFTDVIADYFDASLSADEDNDDSDSDSEEVNGGNGQPQPAEVEQTDTDSSKEEEDFFIVKTDVDYKAEDKVCEYATSTGKFDIKSRSNFTCSCVYNDGKPCSLRFQQLDLRDLRTVHQSLGREELDLVVLSQIQAGLHDGEKTQRPKQKEQSKRQRVRVDYFHKGSRICRDTFMYIHGIFKKRLTSLISHYQDYGVVARIRGNTNRLPRNVLTYQHRLNVVRFISNFAEEHAVLLSGRIPGYSRDDLKLLPSSCTKASVYQMYVTACEAGKMQRIVSQRVFLQLWRECMPDVMPMKISTDLCWTCQRNSVVLGHLGSMTEQERPEKIAAAQQHLLLAIQERAEYKAVIQKAKEAVEGQQLPVRLRVPGHAIPDCHMDMLAHYSFDFAQQVHYPSSPLQPGPMYFKTPRKCGVFGVMAEAIPQMILFLLDEAVETGKGANAVISMLDFFFENYGLKETECHLHADNCNGQNKNNAMIQYLLWRVMTKRHKKITLSFLVAGHTKFGPDWCFGLFKRTFRRTKVDCLGDIVDVAKRSSASGIIVPQLCGTEDGSPLVPVRKWSEFLDDHFTKLVGIKKFHHFEFFKSGEVCVRLYANSNCQVIKLLKDPELPPDDQIAPIIKPPGLSRQRTEYLYKEIREFVADKHQDVVCPMPPAIQSKLCNTSIPAPTIVSTNQEVPVIHVSKKKVGRLKKSLRGLAARNNNKL